MMPVRSFLASALAAVAACGSDPPVPKPPASAIVTAVVDLRVPAPPSDDVTPPPVASAPASCEGIARTIASAEARLAAEAYSCKSDADCACYGGPVCPNQIASRCPSAIGAAAQRELSSLEKTWQEAGCGGYLWSPSRCEASCRDGECAAKDKRPLSADEQADRCGYKGSLICCLGPPGITPPPKPLCYPAD